MLRETQRISIHAPRKGCDELPVFRRGAHDHFNPRTPCGVRLNNITIIQGDTYISIHAPLAGCDAVRGGGVLPPPISIHAPLAGCDRPARALPSRTKYFNPRTPCGVRPPQRLCSPRPRGISIHAPLAGCDYNDKTLTASIQNFNPRTPCGVRQNVPAKPKQAGTFQSTHPLRGATLCDIG